MRQAVDADIPVLGLCFGGQMLARVLGAEVFRSPTRRWLAAGPQRRSRPDTRRPVVPVALRHVHPPPGATVIAETDVGPQAFIAGRSLGLQFHPEVTSEIMGDWVREYRHELDADGVDPDALLEETRRAGAESRRMALQLLERYLSDVAGLVSRPPGDGRPADNTPARGGHAGNGTPIRRAGLPALPRSPISEHRAGEGVWLFTTDGRRILDACSGGAMVACLGHGVPEIAAAAAEQAERISYYYNHQFTSEPQERLAERLLEVAAPEMTRARFVSSGSEANETALQMARLYHVERGDTQRWRGSRRPRRTTAATMGTLALSGGGRSRNRTRRTSLSTSTSRRRRGGSIRAARPRCRSWTASSRRPDRDTVAAYFCEPVSAAALPAYAPPERFWRGLAERRDEHGFLVCFDEVVTGMGPCGELAGTRHQLPSSPTSSAIGELGAGYAPLAACALAGSARVRRGAMPVLVSSTSDIPGTAPRGSPPRWAWRFSGQLIRSETSWTRVHERGPGVEEQSLRTRSGGGSEIVREVPREGIPHRRGARRSGRRRVVPAPRARRPRRSSTTSAFEHELLVTSAAYSGRRPRGGPDAHGARLREHGRRALGDGRPARCDHRHRGTARFKDSLSKNAAGAAGE